MTNNPRKGNEVTGVKVKVAEAEHDAIALLLDCWGALEKAKIAYSKDGFYASFAWPKKRILLMVDDPLSNWDCSDSAAEEVTYREERDEYFADRGWVVLHVNPRGIRMEKQIARIALTVKHAQPHRKLAS